MADIKYYDVIKKPVITEKSMNAMAEKKYTFLVGSGTGPLTIAPFFLTVSMIFAADASTN